MSEFVKRTLAELSTNPTTSSNELVKMLVESTNKSIALGERSDVIYNNLKNGISTIAKQTKLKALNVLLEQFTKSESTPFSQVEKIAKEAALSEKISVLKESAAYANPIVKTKVDAFDSAITQGYLDFVLCESFISTFESYSYDEKIKSTVNSVKNYLAENKSKITMLNAIYGMSSLNYPGYSSVISDLTDRLISEEYSADILKVKYGTSIPAISSLINELRIIESQESGSFTLGEGNTDTQISNLITPAIKTEEGLLLYTDDRFISIREAAETTGNELKVRINSDFKISEVDPNYVKAAHRNFYDLCEAFATLGFRKTADGLGVESNSIKNVKLGFRTNENQEIDAYLNDSKVGELKSLNLSESLVFESVEVKSKIQRLIENFSSIYNFDFIKEVTNDRLLSEALVLNLNNRYFVCEKVNAADRDWTEMNEHKLYTFFQSKFNYDISPVFGTKIDESVRQIQEIEAKKKEIANNIEKLEASATKLNEACSNPNLTTSEISKLEAIKESVEKTIQELKNSYIEVDLLKKK